MSTKHRYYPELDGVRAFAALLVILFHAAQDGLPIPGPVQFGQTGVDLFFVLSGFLITSILLKARQHDWSEVRTFYARRTLRIFPLYFGVILLAAVLGDVYSWPFWVYLQNFWLSFHIPIDGPAHFWSLAVEEQFYLVWPFLVLFSPRRYLLPLLWTMIAGAFVCRFFLARHGLDVFGLTFTRIDGLAAGGVLAVLHGREALARWRNPMLGGLVAATALLLSLSLRYRGLNNPWFLASKYSLLSAMYACLIGWLLCSAGSPVNRALRVAPLRFIGRISYGLYVFHPYVFALTIRHLPGRSPWLQAGTASALTLLVACLSWYGYERHFIKLKSRWAPEPRPTPRAALDV